MYFLFQTEEVEISKYSTLSIFSPRQTLQRIHLPTCGKYKTNFPFSSFSPFPFCIYYTCTVPLSPTRIPFCWRSTLIATAHKAGFGPRKGASKGAPFNPSLFFRTLSYVRQDTFQLGPKSWAPLALCAVSSVPPPQRVARVTTRLDQTSEYSLWLVEGLTLAETQTPWTLASRPLTRTSKCERPLFTWTQLSKKLAVFGSLSFLCVFLSFYHILL